MPDSIRAHKAAIAACAPYAVWMALMFALPSGAVSYAIRAAAGAVALAAAWRAFGWRVRGAARAILAGLVVYALWTFPEYSAFYREWFVVGACPSPLDAQTSPFDPSVCGWPLAIARLAGSAFVIAPAEELFFRHFLYCFLQPGRWNDGSPRRFDFQALAWSAGLFALEHDRPLAAVAAGAIYTLVYIRSGLGAAAVAHATTNFVLGVHVLATGAWAFW